MELTEVEFWESYWANCVLPAEIDKNLSFDRCLASAIKTHIPQIEGEVFEVGCAPGKWLAYMAKEFSLVPSGLEYSKAGMKATEKNFEILGLQGGEIYTGDFFNIQPIKQFDVVMSFGFIEHFSNVDEVINLHLDWLKPGGVLVLGVPNFRGIYKFIQGVLDQEILDKHNLDIMNLEFFQQLKKRFPISEIYSGYIGSFEPSLPIAKYKYGNPLQFSVKLFLKFAGAVRKLKVLDRVNTPYISSCLLGIYKKDA